MASSTSNDDDGAPKILPTSPPVETGQQAQDAPRRRLPRQSHSDSPNTRHIRLEARSQIHSSVSSIYMGSYGHHQSRSRASIAGSAKSPVGSVPGTPRTSISHTHLQDLLQDLNLDLETYGVEELRDGFFDASFFKPPKTNHDDLMRDAENTLPLNFQKPHPLSTSNFLPRQWSSAKTVCRNVTTTRAGIKLIKSFLAVFIAYILCLVPSIRQWLGRYSYIMVLSTIFNHPGRTLGAQLDGTFLTIVGTATGLGWGAFALWLSDSTGPARQDYGGILAAFLALFMGTSAALRSYFIRIYQLVVCAGIAVAYTCLADTSEHVAWHKLFSYGIPWLFGQALCLLISCTVIPDAGARPLAVSLHDAFEVMQRSLVLPSSDDTMLHRQLALTFVGLSQAYRDLTLDTSITRFQPTDIMILRNLMQAVIRSLLSMKRDVQLFDEFEGIRKSRPVTPEPDTICKPSRLSKILSNGASDPNQTLHASLGITNGVNDAVIDIDRQTHLITPRTDIEVNAIKLVTNKLAEPTSELLSSMKSSLARCDAVLMEMSGHRKYLGPTRSVSSDILGALTTIRKSMIQYDEEEDKLMEDPTLPRIYSNHPEVVELFLFVHPIRQAASSVEALLVKVNEMQQRHRGWRLYLPSYPWAKALQRTNAQVRHDRGGVTVGFYFRSQSQLARTMKGMANIYKPLPRHSLAPTDPKEEEVIRTDSMGKYEEEEDIAMNPTSHAAKKKRFRYKLWLVLHRLQGFETRFALKVAITTSLLSIPAWLPQSRGWWNANESWWAVVTVWIMSSPRVGGNIQDLITRALCAILGAVWGGLAYGADDGNPYVMAVFAAIFLIPMMYRYTQSSHPRSGVVGCTAFVVISLGAKAADGLPSIVHIAWTRGLAFLVGVVAAVVVNWILWPFVARHELRKALSAMLIYSSIIYRGVVARYIYYQDGEEPQEKDIERSEMLEGRLREGFVRIRQLLALTRHELRLRGPFNALPYSALIDGCEGFFEYLVAVRQSSLFFHPRFMADNEQAVESLLAHRRDAVAAILMNLYVLAGALRGDRKVPRYLPSAAAARKRLLDHMAELEALQSAQQDSSNEDERGAEKDTAREDQHRIASPSFVNLEYNSAAPSKERDGRRWAQIYSYSYSQNLTGCVKQLEVLQKYTKEIVGEQGFDPIDTSVYEDLT